MWYDVAKMRTESSRYLRQKRWKKCDATKTRNTRAPVASKESKTSVCQSGSPATRRPPVRRTRIRERRTSLGFVTCCRTRSARTASNEQSGKGSSRRLALTKWTLLSSRTCAYCSECRKYAHRSSMVCEMSTPQTWETRAALSRTSNPTLK